VEESARVLGAAVVNVVLGPPDNITKGHDGVAVAEGDQMDSDVVRPSGRRHTYGSKSKTRENITLLGLASS
jgi:hypothetical protein